VAQACPGHAGAAGDPAGAEPALAAVLLPERRLHRRAALPHHGGGRRLHAGMPDPGGGHFAFRYQGGERAGCRHRPARSDPDLCCGQRHGTHQRGDPRMIAGDEDPVALHGARKAHPERLLRVLQRAPPGRTTERGAVLLAGSSQAGPAAWRDDCNTVRPHSAIGNKPPISLLSSSVSQDSS